MGMIQNAVKFKDIFFFLKCHLFFCFVSTNIQRRKSSCDIDLPMIFSEQSDTFQPIKSHSYKFPFFQIQL